MLELVLTALLTVGPVEVVASCGIEPDRVLVHVAVRVEWKDMSGATHSTDELWHLACSRETKACSGVRVNLDKRRGTALAIGANEVTDLSAMAVLRSVSGSVATIAWGTHVLVLDVSSGVLTMTAPSSIGFATERGVGRCKPG